MICCVSLPPFFTDTIQRLRVFSRPFLIPTTLADGTVATRNAKPWPALPGSVWRYREALRPTKPCVPGISWNFMKTRDTNLTILIFAQFDPRVVKCCLPSKCPRNINQAPWKSWQLRIQGPYSILITPHTTSTINLSTDNITSEQSSDHCGSAHEWSTAARTLHFWVPETIAVLLMDEEINMGNTCKPMKIGHMEQNLMEQNLMKQNNGCSPISLHNLSHNMRS